VKLIHELARRVASLLRWLVALEIGIWRSLFLLITRRVPGRGPGVEAFSYVRAVAPIIGAFIFVSALEMVVVHLLLPWETIRLIVLVLSVWGLLWMFGYLASMKVFPHLVGPEGLRIRSGTSADIAIPWDAVAAVRYRRGSVGTQRRVEVERGDDGTAVSVPVLKLTRVEVVLRAPTTVALPGGPEEVTAVRLYADDHRGLVARAREHLAAGAQAAEPAADRG
jgi:hypothetical protein